VFFCNCGEGTGLGREFRRRYFSAAGCTGIREGLSLLFLKITILIQLPTFCASFHDLIILQEILPYIILLHVEYNFMGLSFEITLVSCRKNGTLRFSDPRPSRPALVLSKLNSLVSSIQKKRSFRKFLARANFSDA
jgi:hypothetical protein